MKLTGGIASLAFVFLSLMFACSCVAVALEKKAEPAEARVFETVPIWFHVHAKQPGDDGSETVKGIADYLKAKGYRGVVYTPHSHGLSFPAFKELVDAENTADFITVPGREIATLTEDDTGMRVMCHLNAVSDAADPAVLDIIYKEDRIREVLAKLDEEKAFYVWNHGWACRQWTSLGGLFDGIEMFNDIGPGFINGESYNFERSEYLDALKNGKKLFVVSGIDMHVMAQAALAEFTTYVFPDEFSRASLVSAIRAGHTIAAYNARLYSLNARPSVAPATAAGNTFEIKGSAGLNSYNGFKPSFNIYKDGEKYTPGSPVLFMRGAKRHKGYITYDFSFGDTLAAGGSACYVFEIPHYMISSPYCFATEK